MRDIGSWENLSGNTNVSELILVVFQYRSFRNPRPWQSGNLASCLFFCFVMIAPSLQDPPVDDLVDCGNRVRHGEDYVRMHFGNRVRHGFESKNVSLSDTASLGHQLSICREPVE